MVKQNIHRFDIWLVRLDPTKGSEIKKTRPCVIISPDEMSSLKTAIIAPMTSKGFNFPTRIQCTFQGKFLKVPKSRQLIVCKNYLHIKKRLIDSPCHGIMDTKVKWVGGQATKTININKFAWPDPNSSLLRVYTHS